MADEVKQPLSEKASKDESKQLSETASQSEVKQLSETDVHKESDLVSDDDEKPETMAEDSKTADEQVAGLEMTLTVPEPPKANEKAIEFLSSIGEDELLLTAFSETLGCFSDTKAQIGEFTILVQPAIYRGFEDCYLVHVTSHSTIDDIPCNSSIYAYVSKRFETLEQQRQEYIKMKEQFLEKKTHMVKQGDKLVVESFITEGKHFAPQLVKHHTTSYPWNTLEGFVSQASNFLILRILARRRAVPENMIFLVFDGEKNLCQSTYDELGFQMQTIGQDTIDVYGIERTIHSEVDLPISWQNYFLADGHLSSRFQVGSPISMKVLSMPVLVEKEEIDPKPKFGKQALNWEMDAQLSSQFLDWKEELSADHATYMRQHPEMRLLLSDFLQFLLLRKPDDVVTFAAEFFTPHSARRPAASSFRISNIKRRLHSYSLS